MTIEQELAENQALIDQAKAVLKSADDLGMVDDSPEDAVSILRRNLEQLVETRSRLAAKQAYLKASGG